MGVPLHRLHTNHLLINILLDEMNINFQSVYFGDFPDVLRSFLAKGTVQYYNS